MVVQVRLREASVVQWVLQFLEDRQLVGPMRLLEQETGLCSHEFASEDIRFFRELVLDGDWQGTMAFLQPLAPRLSPPTPGAGAGGRGGAAVLEFSVLRQQLLELLSFDPSVASRALQAAVAPGAHGEGGQAVDGATAEPGGDTGANHIAGLKATKQATLTALVACLRGLQARAPSAAAFTSLCQLLSLRRVQDHEEYRGWNVNVGRKALFDELLGPVASALGCDTSQIQASLVPPDRLTTFLAQGAYFNHAGGRQLEVELQPLDNEAHHRAAPAWPRATVPAAGPAHLNGSRPSSGTPWSAEAAPAAGDVAAAKGRQPGTLARDPTPSMEGAAAPAVPCGQATVRPGPDPSPVDGDGIWAAAEHEPETDFRRPETTRRPSADEYTRVNSTREQLRSDPDRGSAVEALYHQHTAPVPRDIVPRNLTAAPQRPHSQRRYSSAGPDQDRSAPSTTPLESRPAHRVFQTEVGAGPEKAGDPDRRQEDVPAQSGAVRPPSPQRGGGEEEEADGRLMDDGAELPQHVHARGKVNGIMSARKRATLQDGQVRCPVTPLPVGRCLHGCR